MDTRPVTTDRLNESVIAVPPLARNSDLSINRTENEKIIRHLEAGGVSTLLYGGNAILYHIAISEYAGLLDMLTELAGEQSLVIPSVGPAFGTMMDQAEILREYEFPTAMLLPQQGITTSAGVATAIRHFVSVYGKPVVLYIKFDKFIDIVDVKRLVDDELISWIKYAVVRPDTIKDDFLRALTDSVGSERIVSGIGEQPAISHVRDFGLAGFTSGCVCVAPRLSMQMLRAIHENDFDRAERIRKIFQPMENLRNDINPIRVLHAAVALAGIAETGPVMPMLSEIAATDTRSIRRVATELLEQDGQS